MQCLKLGLHTFLTIHIVMPRLPDPLCQACCATIFKFLQYPKAAASVGTAYLVGALAYFVGYSTGEPKNRLAYGGPVRLASQIVLAAMCARIGYDARPRKEVQAAGFRDSSRR